MRRARWRAHLYPVRATCREQIEERHARRARVGSVGLACSYTRVHPIILGAYAADLYPTLLLAEDGEDGNRLKLLGPELLLDVQPEN
jgi:hypothetical protein